MRIESLHPEGFGHFSGQEIGPLESPLTVVHGHNEAGKSTLLAFIRTILFGFPPQNRAKYYPPLAGGRHGGRISLLDDENRRYVIERLEAPGSQTLRITLPDGTQSNDESVLRNLLGNAGRPLFESVFAFGLLDLQRLDALDNSGLAQQIYAAGMGAANLPAVQESLTREAGNIFKQGGSAQEAAKLFRALTQVDGELDRLRGESAEYAAKSAEEQALEAEITAIGDESRELATQLAELDLLARAWDDWVARDDLTRRLAQLPEFPGFPAEAVSRFERASQDLAEATDNCQSLGADLGRLRQRAAVPIPDEPLLAAAGLAEEVGRQRGNLEHSIVDLPARQAELADAEARVREGIQKLGPGWDEASVAAFDVSLPVRDAITAFGQRLADAASTERDARARADLAAEALAAAREREDAARDTLAATTPPSLTTTEISATRDLVRSARSRLGDAAAASTHRALLEAQQAILDARQQEHPSPARTTLAAWVVGAAAIGALSLGLLAGGIILLLAVFLAVVLGIVAGALLQLSRRHLDANAWNHRIPGLDEAVHAESAIRAELAALVARLGCAPSSDALDRTERTLDEHQHNLDRQEAALAALATETAESERLAARHEQAAQLLGQAGEHLARANEGWTAWLQSHGLATTLSPASTLDLLGRIEALQGELRARDKTRDDRVAKIAADIRRETVRVVELAAAASLPVDPENHRAVLHAADDLIRRFRAAQEAANRRDSLHEQIEARQADLEHAEQKREKAEEALAHLLESCGVNGEADLRARAALHEERGVLAAALESRELALRTLAGPGEPYDRLLLRLAESDITAVRLQRESLASRRAELTDRATAAGTELGEVRLRLKQLAVDSRSSDLRAQRAVIIEQLRVHAENWSRLTIASALLNRARSRFERERQPEVVSEAGKYFATMTQGRYEGIFVPIGSSSVQALPAGGGEPRLPQQLSQGTQEQLYLSMRFGLVEHFARQATTLPIVVDEILVNFDPDRARAAAAGFARVAQNHQVIVFTCHPWVVEIFRSAEPRAQVIELDGVAARQEQLAPTASP
ncbi:MAG: AAA family ATPase [Dehalococcoidia bacterium]|nr:AAA family ATPase [Dehalococcoidia bacterium]